MNDDIFEDVSEEVKQSNPKVEKADTKDKTDEQIKDTMTVVKVKKKKEETKYEKCLREAKDVIKDTKDKIEKLKKINPKERTDEEKKQIQELSKKLQEQKYELAKARREYDRDKNSRSVRQQKKKLEEGKQQAIIKILQAEGIETENEVKTLIKIKRVLKKYGVKDITHLKNVLEYVGYNIPQLLE